MIYDYADPLDSFTPRRRILPLRERSHRPTFYRDYSTFHEPGAGGITYEVTYVGAHIGLVLSRWSKRHGVHWIAYAHSFIRDKDRLKAYPDRYAATDALLELAGWKGDTKP